MVTTRNPKSKGAQFRDIFEGYLDFKGVDVTLRTTTRTLDNGGRMTATSTVTSTLKADIQWYTKRELDKGNLGNVKTGDGKLFVKHDSGIDIEDDTKFYEVDYNSERWRLISQMEGEQIEGLVGFMGFQIRKNAQ